MSDHHRIERLDRRTAKRLLDGADGHARLQALLSSAAAPAQPGELAGEDAAVAAFNAAARTARTSRAVTWRRFLTVKALVVMGASLIVTGGAAYATITGNLPGREPAPSETPSLHHETSTSQGSTKVSHAPPSAPPSSPPSSKTRPSPSTSPSAGTSKEPPGRVNAPGRQQKKTTAPQNTRTAPQNTRTPPRGPGHNNGSPPGDNSGNGNGNGQGNGNGDNGSSPRTNSGNGNGPPS
ncbi:hypothetical protein E1281_08670 [Actinomadura sp. KC345]|uniref:hypothetical protein n=1 Tax=Actinomadura sp. KC345 TaxID=2530371 RepID=UPI001053AD74|nr:hypothetical protein [Actinomadura sp. KC345]TDC56170.1 hypothetical protein E1281_08670 [Actinomadura sp. KC345]